MDRVPPGQSPASGSVVKSACDSSNGMCEAGWSEGAGRVIEPRNSVVVVIGITSLRSQRRKADGLFMLEGSSSGSDMAMSLGHHRGLRAGHVFTGVTRELGRAVCLLEEPATRAAGCMASWRRRIASGGHSCPARRDQHGPQQSLGGTIHPAIDISPGARAPGRSSGALRGPAVCPPTPELHLS